MRTRLGKHCSHSAFPALNTHTVTWGALRTTTAQVRPKVLPRGAGAGPGSRPQPPVIPVHSQTREPPLHSSKGLQECLSPSRDPWGWRTINPVAQRKQRPSEAAEPAQARSEQRRSERRSASPMPPSAQCTAQLGGVHESRPEDCLDRATWTDQGPVPACLSRPQVTPVRPSPLAS